MTVDIMDLMKELFVVDLDHTLTSISITILLFFYGFDVVKDIIRNTEGTKAQKFIIFGILVLFGINLILVFLTKIVLSITDSNLKWIVIIGLIGWCFYKFDSAVLGTR